MDNIFIAFNSINNISHNIYVKKDRTIINYNLNEQKVITQIKNTQERIINNFNHYLDKIKKRDLIMSIFADDSRIKLWNMNILYLKDAYFLLDSLTLFQLFFLHIYKKINNFFYL